jgi:hypothetical protein
LALAIGTPAWIALLWLVRRADHPKRPRGQVMTDMLAQIQAVAAAASPADLELFDRIVALVASGEHGSVPCVLPPAVAASLFLHGRDLAARFIGVRPKTIEHFADRMAAGNWTGTTPISFVHGALLDGQHRLAAAAISGIPLAVTIDVLDDSRY